MKHSLSVLTPSLCLALAATALPAVAQTGPADALQSTLTFNNPDVFNHNFFTTSASRFTVNNETGLVTAPGGQSAETAIYSPGNGAAPTGYKNALNAFYDGSVGTTFSMERAYSTGSASMQTIARLQDSGLAIIGLMGINVSNPNNGTVNFRFGVIDLGNHAVSNYFGTGGSNGITVTWPGTEANYPAGSKLKMVMEADNLNFQLSLRNEAGDVLASSGWQTMGEAIAAEFNKAGGVGFRTSWNNHGDNTYTIHEFDFTPAIPEPAHLSLIGAATVVIASSAFLARAKSRTAANR